MKQTPASRGLLRSCVIAFLLFMVSGSITAYASVPYAPEAIQIVVEKPILHPEYGSLCTTYWYRYNNNRNQYAYLTLNTNNQAYSTNSGDWYATIPVSGQYKVEAYIPLHEPIYWSCSGKTIGYDTSDARYTIYHAGGSTTVSKDQKPLDNEWLNLGTYSFSEGESARIHLSDLNSETSWTRTISFSAVRFTYVTGAVEGTVSDGISPVAGIEISANLQGTNAQNSNSSIVYTDENGYYKTPLSIGIYVLVPRNPDPTKICIFNPAYRIIVVPPGEREGHFLTTMQCHARTGSIYGHVWDQETGQSLSNATLSIAGKIIRTSSLGSFRSGNIPIGTHRVEVSAPNYKSRTSSVTITENQEAIFSTELHYVDPGYYLPFPGGTTRKVSQGNNSKPSHTGNAKYAFDFSMTLGSKVVAVRDGTVFKISPRQYGRGGCSPNYQSMVNYIVIYHPDKKTYSWYFHVANTYHLRVGDRVVHGQPIGRTDSSGWWCGGHLHFELRKKGGGTRSISVGFMDVKGNVPIAGQTYTSGNYVIRRPSSMIEPTSESSISTYANVFLQVTGYTTNTISIYTELPGEQIEMRLASSAPELEISAWQPYTDTLPWSYNQVWAQMRNEDGQMSEIVSDTMSVVAFGALHADFIITDTVCTHQPIFFDNLTEPYCEQCAYTWDFGNGINSSLMHPGLAEYLDGPEEIPFYTQPGLYTVILTATGINTTDSISHTLQVYTGIDITTAFSYSVSGDTYTFSAGGSDITSWEWDFGDGYTGSGQVVTHTYAPDVWLQAYDIPVTLRVTNANSCSLEIGIVIPQRYFNFIPMIMRNSDS